MVVSASTSAVDGSTSIKKTEEESPLVEKARLDTQEQVSQRSPEVMRKGNTHRPSAGTQQAGDALPLCEAWDGILWACMGACRSSTEERANVAATNMRPWTASHAARWVGSTGKRAWCGQYYQKS